MDEFIKEVKKCVEDSNTDLYSNEPDSSLQLSPFNAIHKKIYDEIQRIATSKDMKDVSSWLPSTASFPNSH